MSPHTSPLWASYGVSFLSYSSKNYRDISRAHCNYTPWPWPLSSRSFGLGLENRVPSVASTVLDGFFPYLVQMITSMRRCVACDNLWPWPISSRSSDLDLENRVCSVASLVPDGFFLYLAQMITIIRGCATCYVFFAKSENLNFWQFFKNFRAWPWNKSLQFSMDYFHI